MGSWEAILVKLLVSKIGQIRDIGQQSGKKENKRKHYNAEDTILVTVFLMYLIDFTNLIQSQFLSTFELIQTKNLN